ADAGDGVSTYLALIFGTLLSSQGTDASFVLTRVALGLSSGQFPFGLAVLRFRLYQIFFRSDSLSGGFAFRLSIDLAVSLAAFRHSLR
ncbi:hypothetical protein AB0M31_16535, partial [Streptomyces sp. NPDC051773]|uniref:hypothetical protein n=1 Tax=Streptomyces sp. NPDC051773 TaxID=3156682 RepID=UPI00341A1C8E